MFDIYPKNGHLLLKRIDPAATSKGGIELPEASRGQLNYGYIDGVTDTEEVYKVDDLVMFQPFAGVTVSLNEEAYLFLHVDDILAILHPREPVAPTEEVDSA